MRKSQNVTITFYAGIASDIPARNLRDKVVVFELEGKENSTVFKLDPNKMTGKPTSNIAKFIQEDIVKEINKATGTDKNQLNLYFFERKKAANKTAEDILSEARESHTERAKRIETITKETSHKQAIAETIPQQFPVASIQLELVDGTPPKITSNQKVIIPSLATAVKGKNHDRHAVLIKTVGDPHSTDIISGHSIHTSIAATVATEFEKEHLKAAPAQQGETEQSHSTIVGTAPPQSAQDNSARDQVIDAKSNNITRLEVLVFGVEGQEYLGLESIETPIFAKLSTDESEDYAMYQKEFFASTGTELVQLLGQELSQGNILESTALLEAVVLPKSAKVDLEEAVIAATKNPTGAYYNFIDIKQNDSGYSSTQLRQAAADNAYPHIAPEYGDNEIYIEKKIKPTPVKPNASESHRILAKQIRDQAIDEVMEEFKKEFSREAGQLFSGNQTLFRQEQEAQEDEQHNKSLDSDNSDTKPGSQN